MLLNRLNETTRNLSWYTFKEELRNQVGLQNNEWGLNEQLRTLSLSYHGYHGKTE